jgi:hypothetical protein
LRWRPQGNEKRVVANRLANDLARNIDAKKMPLKPKVMDADERY